MDGYDRILNENIIVRKDSFPRVHVRFGGCNNIVFLVEEIMDGYVSFERICEGISNRIDVTKQSHQVRISEVDTSFGTGKTGKGLHVRKNITFEECPNLKHIYLVKKYWDLVSYCQ